MRATPPTCLEWRERTQAYLRGQGGDGDRDALAQHRATCPDCAQHYRDSVELLARMRSGHAGEVHESPASPAKPKRKGRWLLIVLPIVLLLVWQTFGHRATQAVPRLRCTQGKVECDGRVLQLGEGSSALVEGSRVVLPEGASAELRLPRVQGELSGPLKLAVERLEPLRLRVQEGSLEVEGELRVISNLAELELNGARARIAVNAQEVRITSLGQGAKLTDLVGTRLLEPNREVVVRP